MQYKASRTTVVVLYISYIILAVVAIYSLRNIITIERHLSKIEGQCIARYISEGVERKDIVTHDGNCWVE